ncbi:DUF2971 domain-containing protein [Butyrivibrio sp. FCS006]|uniref:DUF2971 domain-containing protein n=1 Tax=Butyrivibrio sp. FCS006 TaxID=1280684 RepID=UPI000405B6BC|nr:DUF2971 domain-containing protein [Butyrivibrio sp. FCS006]
MPRTTPSILYHYTSLETLQAILQNKTIRLSDITKSNDSKEISLISSYIDDIYQAAYNAETAKIFIENVSAEEWQKQVAGAKKKWFENDHNGFSYYVCCFSKAEDLLSQWRGYADDGRGVAIGFDKEALEKLINNYPPIKVVEVEYNERIQRGKVRDQADLLIKGIKEYIKSIYRGGEAIPLKQKMVELFDKSFNEVFKLAIEMKNSFFHEEKEMRLCFLVNNSRIEKSRPLRSGPEVIGGTLYLELKEYEEEINKFAVLYPFKFFLKNNGISSYVDLGFKKYCDKAGGQLIRNVWLGPKCGATIDEIQRMFRQQRFGDIEVKKSRGSYR